MKGDIVKDWHSLKEGKIYYIESLHPSDAYRRPNTPVRPLIPIGESLQFRKGKLVPVNPVVDQCQYEWNIGLFISGFKAIEL